MSIAAASEPMGLLRRLHTVFARQYKPVEDIHPTAMKAAKYLCESDNPCNHHKDQAMALYKLFLDAEWEAARAARAARSPSDQG